MAGVGAAVQAGARAGPEPGARSPEPGARSPDSVDGRPVSGAAIERLCLEMSGAIDTDLQLQLQLQTGGERGAGTPLACEADV